jgi:hypothetical protein
LGRHLDDLPDEIVPDFGWSATEQPRHD